VGNEPQKCRKEEGKQEMKHGRKRGVCHAFLSTFLLTILLSYKEISYSLMLVRLVEPFHQYVEDIDQYHRYRRI
jgi:hypothetical protein